eukprot:1257335-Rhodomonas_salina.2
MSICPASTKKEVTCLVRGDAAAEALGLGEVTCQEQVAEVLEAVPHQARASHLRATIQVHQARASHLRVTIQVHQARPVPVDHQSPAGHDSSWRLSILRLLHDARDYAKRLGPNPNP